MTKIPGIKQMQIVQKKIDEIQVNFVLDETVDNRPKTREGERSMVHGLESVVREALLEELHAVFGDITIKLVKVDEIPREKNGKYRFSICRM